MASTADTQLIFEEGDVNDKPVIASTIIYEGAAVGVVAASGHCRLLAAGDSFAGFARKKADNTGGTAAAINVNLKEAGKVQLSIGSLAATDVGKPVYASDSNTFTLTATGNSFIGRVDRFISSGVGIVSFDARKGKLGRFTALTDSSGGTASDTIAAIGGSYSQSVIANAFASLTAKINNLAQQLS